MVRCFVAVFLPTNIIEKITNIQKIIQKLPMRCKLVEKENLHITLSFLGELSEEEIENKKAALDSLAIEFKKFEANIGKLKLIPSKNFFRVIAYEIIGMEKLSSAVKNFVGGDVKSPHITLCRIKQIEDKKKSLESLEKIGDLNEKLLVKEIALVKSKLNTRGPEYSILHVARFQD